MSDDLSYRAAPDRTRINMEHERDVRFWTKELDVTEQQLRELVARHGLSPKKVREALQGR
jgi:hypothetical protein